MEVGIGFSEDLPLATQSDLAREVEAAGFSSLWTNESRGRDALLVCQAWGTATDELHVGTAVVPIWTRTPAQLAMASATIQDATGGRFLLGIGVSHPATMDPWHDAGYRRPLSAARETIEVLSRVGAGDSSELDGEVFRSRGFQLELEPLPPPAPVYLAAMGPRMLKLAGEVADGVLLNWSTPEEVGRAAANVRGAAAGSALGRAQTEVAIAGYVRVAVARDPEAARAALAGELSRYCALSAYASHFARQGFAEAVDDIRSAFRDGGPEASRAAVPEAMLRRLGWYGTPDESPTALLARYAGAGMNRLIARVVVVDGDPVGSLRLSLEALTDVPLTGAHGATRT